MGDVISRQDTINELKNVFDDILCCNVSVRKGLPEAVRRIEMMPSAEPKTGHWYIREYEYFTCSECGEDYWNSCDSTAEAEELLETGDYPNYCPNCGADMRGGKHE